MAQIVLPGGEAREVAVFLSEPMAGADGERLSDLLDAELKGLFAYVQPAGRARLTDYLNDAPPFLRLLQGDMVALINKRHVAYVEALSR